MPEFNIQVKCEYCGEWAKFGEGTQVVSKSVGSNTTIWKLGKSHQVRDLTTIDYTVCSRECLVKYVARGLDDGTI